MSYLAQLEAEIIILKIIKRWKNDFFLINSQKKTKKDKIFLFTYSKIADLKSNYQFFLEFLSFLVPEL